MHTKDCGDEHDECKQFNKELGISLMATKSLQCVIATKQWNYKTSVKGLP